MKNLDALEDKKQTERLVTEIRKDSKRLQSLQQCHICFSVSGNIAVIARFACSILLPCCSLSNGSCRKPCPTMPSIQLPLLLLCLTLCGICLSGGHLLPEESENMGKSPLNDILQRSESLILQSALKKAEKEEEINKGISLIGAPIWWWDSTWLRSLDPRYDFQVVMLILSTGTKGRGRIRGLLQYTDRHFFIDAFFSKISLLRKGCIITKQLLHNKKVDACHRKPASLGKLLEDPWRTFCSCGLHT